MTAQRVCALSELDNWTPRAVAVADVPVVLVRDGDTVFALRDECSHAELALSDGDVRSMRGGGLGIECFLHGSCFDLRTGAPSSLPATEPVDVFGTRVVDGEDLGRCPVEPSACRTDPHADRHRRLGDPVEQRRHLGVAHHCTPRVDLEHQRLAVLDFNEVIALNLRNERGYYHRALAHIRAGDSEEWIADLRQTLAITPSYGLVYNAFCWGYALAQQPETALPHCDQAVALDSSGSSQDGRGIALAQLGRYEEAVTSLDAYLDWIRTLQPPTLYGRLRGPQVEGWIAALERGENPFDEEILAALR